MREKHRLLIHISVERRSWHGPPTLEPACVVALNVPLEAITDPEPAAWLEGSFVTKKKDWPTLERWLQEGDRPSRIVLIINEGKEILEGNATLRSYEVDQWERPGRPDLIAGSMITHILSSQRFEFEPPTTLGDGNGT